MTLGNWFNTPSNQSLSSQYSASEFESHHDAHEYVVQDRGQVVRPARGIHYNEHSLDTQAHRAELGYLTQRDRDTVYTTASYVPHARSGKIQRSTDISLGRSNTVVRRDTHSHGRPKQYQAPQYTTYATLNDIAEYSFGEPALRGVQVPKSKFSSVATKRPSPPLAADLSGDSHGEGSRSHDAMMLTESKSSGRQMQNSDSTNQTIRRIRHHSRLCDDYEYDGRVVDANSKSCSSGSSGNWI